MAEIGFFLQTENRTDDDDDMIRDFPHDFKSYVKNHQLLCQRGDYNIGWVFSSCERLPPPSPFSGNLQNHTDIIDETLIAAYPQFIDALKNLFREIILKSTAQVLVQFWKVIEIGGKRLLTIQHQPFSLSYIDEGLCLYRLMSLDNECYVDGESEEDLGLLNRVFRHQQEESTPNVRYYSCKEYPQRDHAIVCNIWGSRAIPLFEPSRQDCVGVLEIVTTIEVSKFFYLLELSVYVKNFMTSCLISTPRLNVILPPVCEVLRHIQGDWQGVVGRAVLSQNLVFCKDITQFSITQYPLAHYAREHGLKGCFAICMRSSYTGDNVYVLEFFLPPNYTKGGDPRIALVPLLTTMKKDCKSLKVASGEELGEKLSIEVLDFSEDGKLYSFQIPQTARSPIRMENGEEMVFLDLSDQQLPKVDAIDTRNNVVSNSEENNIVVTSSHQQCIINSSQRPQRKAGIPISLEDLQQHFGMKLDDAAKSLGISRSTVKRACREYNITWWSPRKRSKDNHLLSNKLVQAVVQEQIGEPSQPPISDPPRKQDVATASRPKPRFTVAQDTSVATIKAKYGDDFIRFQLPVLSGMIEFQQQVAKRLNLKGGTYRVKYKDEDNDWILIACDEDLQNYICNSISQGRNTVTMLLQSITNCPP
ncbi:hypothetical protein CsSME_00049541 [Camellia sinensis var. sinensis]